MPVEVDPDRLRRCYGIVKELLLREQTPQGYWVGELSTSALSTATAVMALVQVERGKQCAGTDPDSNYDVHPSPGVATPGLGALVDGGVQWLVAHQNDDGGWGDTVKSFSNISTTMLCHALLVTVDDDHARPSPGVATPGHGRAVENAKRYIDRAGGVPALKKRYGKDKTFSVPILTHCALAGLVDWKEITPLPFELACVPARFYKTVKLPVVSYALPALIAIGQVRHHFAPTWNPITRGLRNLAKQRSLEILERIQPPNGGFLEAAPLTSFVTMSLAAMGLVDHPVVRKGVEFIAQSVRPDGSWPIDTNLATWVTTLAVNALGDDLPPESRLPILNWLLDQQYQEVHPYTNADPGGWAWTDLPGGVPDADDTPGAMLAVMTLVEGLERTESPESRVQSPAQQSPAVATAGSLHHGDTEARRDSNGDDSPRSQAPAWERIRREAPLRNADKELLARVEQALANGTRWLLGLQNRDGGFPTFCRGWGTLPFDRSSADITAHCLRAISRVRQWKMWCDIPAALKGDGDLEDVVEWANYVTKFEGIESLNQLSGQATFSGLKYLDRIQRPDGAWLPLWFGNQHASDETNPTYGTAKVSLALQEMRATSCPEAKAGQSWLRANQNHDGGWGAGEGTPSSVEETALAVEALLEDPLAGDAVARGLGWLMDKVEAVGWPAGLTVGAGESDGGSGQSGRAVPGAGPRTIADPAPIGFYFAKLWYFERLYPLIFAVSCLRRAIDKFPAGRVSSGVDAPARGFPP
ncbi:MAG: prenyltransferase/squalene oxidase repeat-containing protein [Planctomycetaceae bacterium]